MRIVREQVEDVLLVKRVRLPPLDYGTNALTEDFAVSCEVLVTITPEVFKKEFPGRYAILKKLLRL